MNSGPKPSEAGIFQVLLAESDTQLGRDRHVGFGHGVAIHFAQRAPLAVGFICRFACVDAEAISPVRQRMFDLHQGANVHYIHRKLP